MTYEVKFSHSGKSRVKRYEMRKGKEVYRHPKGYFVVLEFQGESGNFRETFFLKEIEAT